MTDAKGRFAFTDLAPSSDYTVSTMAAGYLNGGFAQDRAMGGRNVRLALADGQWIRDVHVPMWRGAVVSGCVTDEAGEPVVDAAVHVLADATIAGSTHVASGAIVRTDDRGDYRIPKLPPGHYRFLVASPHTAMPVGSAMPGSSGPAPPAEVFDARRQFVIARGAARPPSREERRQSYGMAFYGGASIDAATIVALDYGDERSAIDIQLSPVPAVTVAGMLDGPADVRAGLEVRLLLHGLEDALPGAEVATARAAADGSFVFLDVPAGNYEVDASTMSGGYSWSLPPGNYPEIGTSFEARSASAMPPGVEIVSSMFFSAGLPAAVGGQRRFSGRVPVTVGATDVTSVVVPLTRAASISGRAVLDPDEPASPPPPAFTEVLAEPADGSAALGVAQTQLLSGAGATPFFIGGLLRGAYVLHVVSAVGWTTKSITYDGRDYVATPFDASDGADLSGVVVTLTTRAPVVTGRVHDDLGRPSDDAAVIAFPVEPEQWHQYGLDPARIQSVLARPDGTFSVTGLPAGAYDFVAVSAAEADAWQGQDFFAQVASRATRLDLTWGDHKATDLGVVR